MSTMIEYPSCFEAANHASVQHTKMLCPRRSVQISQMSQLVVFECSEEQQWYSADDKIHIKQELSRDARRLGKIISTQSAQDISQDDLYLCIGIEHLLSLSKAKRVLAHRRKHVQMILEAQNKCTEDELQMISQKCSRPARERAQKLAAGYLRMLDA